MWCKIHPDTGKVLGVSRRELPEYHTYREDVTSPDVDGISIAQAVRDVALANVVHIFSDGRTVQARTSDKQAIEDAQDIMIRRNLTEYTWFDASNKKILVTYDDLTELIESGQDQGAAIWETFFNEV